jgi:hypothetical protein
MADTYINSQRIAYQPLHPSVIPWLEEEYIKIHNESLQYVKPDTDWNSLRAAPSRFESTTSGPVKVGSVRPVEIGKFHVLVYTPEGVPPAAGWPVLLGAHGGMTFPFYDPVSPSQRLKQLAHIGGWVLGDPESEEHIWTQICCGLSLGPVSIPRD